MRFKMVVQVDRIGPLGLWVAHPWVTGSSPGSHTQVKFKTLAHLDRTLPRGFLKGMTWAVARVSIVGLSSSSTEQLPWRRSPPDASLPPALCFGKSTKICKHQHFDILHSIFSGLCGLDLTVLSLRTISQVGLAPPLHLFPHVSNACIQFDQTFRSFPSSLSSMSFSSFSASLPPASPLPWQFT